MSNQMRARRVDSNRITVELIVVKIRDGRKLGTVLVIKVTPFKSVAPSTCTRS